MSQKNQNQQKPAQPQQQSQEKSPEPAKRKLLVLTSRILHCGMPIEVFNDAEKVFCNGCHDWVKVEKCDPAPEESKK